MLLLGCYWLMFDTLKEPNPNPRLNPADHADMQWWTGNYYCVMPEKCIILSHQTDQSAQKTTTYCISVPFFRLAAKTRHTQADSYIVFSLRLSLNPQPPLPILHAQARKSAVRKPKYLFSFSFSFSFLSATDDPFQHGWKRGRRYEDSKERECRERKR